jgi:hypothetical protein
VHKIFKYPLKVVDEQVLSLPLGAKILCVQSQLGEPKLWALVDPDAPQENRVIRTHGTGHPVADTNHNLFYLGTYQLQGGHVIFHVFEVLEARKIPS